MSPRRRDGAQRRLAILEATLRIIARSGLRGVTHRTVASEADVPLAATTYYFRDLEDLITESFLHWSQVPRQQVRAFHAAAQAELERATRRRLAPRTVADRLAGVAAEYVLDQVTTHRPDRVLEFAFLHEAARLSRLRIVVRERQMEDRGFLEQFHAALGSRDPAVDAEISYSLLLGLEKSALLSDAGREAAGWIRKVLVSYLRGVLASASA